jgi:hypothetical protein
VVQAQGEAALARAGARQRRLHWAWRADLGGAITAYGTAGGPEPQFTLQMAAQAQALGEAVGRGAVAKLPPGACDVSQAADVAPITAARTLGVYG